MPRYRLRYLCETALRSEQDLPLSQEGRDVLFLFSQKRDAEPIVRLQVDVEAANYREADANAQPILQPVLDALSFATGSPLLILNWDLITKDEVGSKSRRAIWCDKLVEPVTVQLSPRCIDEAKQILDKSGESSLPLLWHRYAIQRNLILDRFLFQWLAFEGLAGKKQIPTVCPNCKEEIAHCERPLLHEGSDRNKAHDLFAQVEPDCSIGEFAREIWGRARNSVFHGTKPPDPALLGQLRSLSPRLRNACDREFARRYELANERPPVRDLELYFHRFKMFEWQTANAEDRFASDFPWDAVQKQFGNMRPGEFRASFPDTWSFKQLNFQKDSVNW